MNLSQWRFTMTGVDVDPRKMNNDLFNLQNMESSSIYKSFFGTITVLVTTIKGRGVRLSGSVYRTKPLVSSGRVLGCV